MQYNFDTINNRRNTNSLKWDVPEGETPMWVADMDFQTAPAVQEAMVRRAKMGIYGYNIVPDEWYTEIQKWWSRRHHFAIDREWLIFCTGVVPAITCAVKRITNVGDHVVVQTPVYDIFFHSIENHGRHVLESQLVYDPVTLSYHIDFEELEEKLADPLTTMMILCNPHNPIGKIWTREELAKIGALCEKHHVVVVSDEIHCDLTQVGAEYIPFASVSDSCRNHSITCISATKAFNFAGLQTAAVMIPSEELFAKMERGLNADEVAEPNSFATDALVAAFREGEPWLEELRRYLDANKQLAAEYLEERIPDVSLIPSDATYLLWIDCSKVTRDTTELVSYIRKETGLYVLAGGQYRGNGSQFIRMNIACPREVLAKSLRLFEKGCLKWQQG